MKKIRTVVWMDDIPIANIEDTENRVVFSLRDNEANHVTVSRNPATLEYNFEVSSGQPVGSVWDEARVRIARYEGYKNPEKHANYHMNEPLTNRADIGISLITYNLPVPFKPMKNKHSKLPGIRLKSPAPLYEISLYFSPKRIYTNEFSQNYEAAIGRLVIELKGRKVK